VILNFCVLKNAQKYNILRYDINMSIGSYFQNAQDYNKLSSLKTEIECWNNNPSIEDFELILSKVENTSLEKTVLNTLRKVSYLSNPDDYEGVNSSLNNLKNFWQQALQLTKNQISAITQAETILQMLYTAVNHSDQEADNAHITAQLQSINNIINDNHSSKITFVYDDTNSNGIIREYNILNRLESDSLPQVPISAVTHEYTNIGKQCVVIESVPSNDTMILNTSDQINNELNIHRQYNRAINNIQSYILSQISKIDSFITRNNNDLKNRNMIVRNILRSLIKKIDKRIKYFKCMGRFYYSVAGTPNIPNWLN